MMPSVWVVRPTWSVRKSEGLKTSSSEVQGDVVLAGDDRGEEGVIGDELHAEGCGAASDFEADATEADDAERFAAELGALQGFFVPFARVHGGVGAGIARAMEIMRPRVSSATATALAPGVFMTTMPRWVAAAVSMLSTPTPARPMTRRLGACSRRCGVRLDGGADDEGVGVG